MTQTDSSPGVQRAPGSRRPSPEQPPTDLVGGAPFGPTRTTTLPAGMGGGIQRAPTCGRGAFRGASPPRRRSRYVFRRSIHEMASVFGMVLLTDEVFFADGYADLEDSGAPFAERSLTQTPTEPKKGS